MKVKNYKIIMMCLDIIELELNKIAKIVNHKSYSEWLKTNEKKIDKKD